MGMMTLFRPKKDLATRLVEGTLVEAKRNNPFDQFQVRSLVAGGMTIEGNITSRNGAAVDGTVSGDVTILGANTALLIRDGARVHGTARAPMVLVRGEVYGDIEGRFVRLFAGCRVHGAIRAGRLVVDDGATILNGGVGIGNEVMTVPAGTARLVPGVRGAPPVADVTAPAATAPATPAVVPSPIPLTPAQPVSSEDRMRDMLAAVGRPRVAAVA